MSGAESDAPQAIGLTRRQILKASAAGAAVAAVGSGAAPHSDPLSPVGRSQAGPWNVITGNGAGLGPGVVAEIGRAHV